MHMPFESQIIESCLFRQQNAPFFDYSQTFVIIYNFFEFKMLSVCKSFLVCPLSGLVYNLCNFPFDRNNLFVFSNVKLGNYVRKNLLVNLYF